MMKRILMGLVAIVVSGTAFASDASKTYAEALHAAVSPCHVMSFKADLDGDLRNDQARINARFGESTPAADNTGINEKISQCLGDAKTKAAGAYKSFSAQTKTPALKQAGKDLLVAYFAYLKVTTDGSHDASTDETVAWRKAESNLDVEASISE